MRLYEGMFLFDSNLASRDWPGLEHHVGEVLKKHSAELLYSERWPDRRLSYEIRGCKKGTYYLTYFKAPPQAIVGLERDCQLSDRVLRLLVVQEEGLEEELEKRRSRQLKQLEDSESRVEDRATPVEGTAPATAGKGVAGPGSGERITESPTAEPSAGRADTEPSAGRADAEPSAGRADVE
ncbi:MAG: 30S ribosomal protein S6 [Planctomycetota bacterium]|nr:30S ribosomal protein S6 [Planctomycetota bacterium]